MFTSPRPAKAVTSMLLLWDTANSLPGTWQAASATYNASKLLRGNGVAGGSGGSDTHTHTITNASTDGSTTGSSASQKKGALTVSARDHSHPITSSSMSTETSLPTYRNLEVIIPTTPGIPTTLPLNAIALFDNTVPTGFQRYSAEDGYFVRASTASGSLSVTNPHGHTSVAFGTNGPSLTYATMLTGSAVTANTNTHTHSLTGGTTDVDGDIAPLHVETILGQVTQDGVAVPTNLISMFDGAPGTGWNVLSDTGGVYNLRYIEGQSAYSTGQGASSHHHHKAAGYTTNSVAGATGLSTGTPAQTVATSHSHTLATPTFSEANNAPAYVDVIIAQKQAVLGVVAPTDVTLTTSNPGTTSETTFGTGEKVSVTYGSASWTLSVIVENQLVNGGNSIPNANVKIRKDGNVVTSDTYTIWSGVTTNVTETNATESLDTTKQVGARSSGTNGDVTEVRPTIQVVIPPSNPAMIYTGSLLFTVV